MERTNLLWDFGMACIVLILYIVGKVWIYYKIDKDNTKQK